MRAHRTDLLSLAFGLFFLALAAWWLLAQLLGLVVPIGWFLAGSLVMIGVLGLLGVLRAARTAARQPAPPNGRPPNGSPAGGGPADRDPAGRGLADPGPADRGLADPGPATGPAAPEPGD